MKEANHAGRYIPNIILTLHPLVQSRIRTPRRTAPNQAEITDLTCSEHSTTSKEMVAWRALVRIYLTRTQDPTPRYTIVWLRYCSLRPERPRRNRKDVGKREESGWRVRMMFGIYLPAWFASFMLFWLNPDLLSLSFFSLLYVFPISSGSLWS